MAHTTSAIRFKAKLQRPATPAHASWTFLVLPASASAKLPTRGMTSVEGTINGAPFLATLEPDGQRSHWLKVPARLRQAARAAAEDLVAVEMRPAGQELEARIPSDLRTALAAAPQAGAAWVSLTPAARRDWIQWLTSARRAETRARRVDGACDMLAKGKRRVCCFDRSGIYSGGLSAPKAAD